MYHNEQVTLKDILSCPPEAQPEAPRQLPPMMLGTEAKQFDPYFIRPDNLDLLLATV